MTSLKRFLRRFVPDRLMAVVRLRQHSSQVRVSVTMVVPDRRTAARWLSVVPDTYRVIVDPGPWPERSDDDVGRFGDPEAAGTASGVLVAPDLDAVVVGDVSRPGLVRRRRVEPDIAPRAIAATAEAVAEIGGPPIGDDLVGLHERLRDAGRRIGVVPRIGDSPIAVQRRDPIDAAAVVIVSGVPMHDVGGGSRASQLAQELVRRGAHVTVAALFGTSESTDLGIRFIHPRLEQRRIDRLDPAALGPGRASTWRPSSR